MTSPTNGARSAMTLFRERHSTMRGVPVFEQDDGSGTGTDTGTGPTDTEAKLLKEVMRLKVETKAAKERLAQFDGITPESIAKLQADIDAAKAAKLQAEQDTAITAENWSSVRASLVAAHQAERAELDARLAAFRKDYEEKGALIADLTIGAAFSGSKFLADETILPGTKARKLYGDHFDLEDGQVVGYDAPRGVTSRQPIVDGDGQPVPFDAAMRRLIDADPERDTLLRSARLAAGKGSKAAAPANVGSGIDRIAAGLRERQGVTDGAPAATLNHRDTNKPVAPTTAAKRDVGPSRIADALKAGALPASSRGGPVRLTP